jgi:hypothetical protein
MTLDRYRPFVYLVIFALLASASISIYAESTTAQTSPANGCSGNTRDGKLDSDGDGLADSQDSDDDNDGMTDVLEAQKGTNPKLKDSDGDQLPDVEEVLDNRVDPVDPCNDDTDGDGWTDGYEADHGTNPTDPESNPENPTGGSN